MKAKELAQGFDRIVDAANGTDPILTIKRSPAIVKKLAVYGVGTCWNLLKQRNGRRGRRREYMNVVRVHHERDDVDNAITRIPYSRVLTRSPLLFRRMNRSVTRARPKAERTRTRANESNHRRKLALLISPFVVCRSFSSMRRKPKLRMCRGGGKVRLVMDASAKLLKSDIGEERKAQWIFWNTQRTPLIGPPETYSNIMDENLIRVDLDLITVD